MMRSTLKPLLLLLVLGIGATASAGSPPVVAEVHVVGNVRVEADAIRAVVQRSRR